MSTKKTSTEAIFQLCSYEHLGSSANYDHDIYLGSSFFNNQLYNDQLVGCTDSPLSEIIHKRKSSREFDENKFNKNTLQEILFNAYSLKNNKGSYTIPQAGGLPVMGLIVLSNSHNQKWTLYHYNSQNYQLKCINSSEIVLQDFFYTKSVNFCSANHCIIITSELQILAKQYLTRGFKFACFQAGHIAQNIILKAAELEVSAVPLGSLIESTIIEQCNLISSQYPLYAVIM